MVDIVFNAENYDVLLNDAKRLGFVYQDEQGHDQILTQGKLRDGGDYLLNYVGQLFVETGGVVTDVLGQEIPAVASRPGVWGRLRINGELPAELQFDPLISQYKYDTNLNGWTSDGVTVAPDWVGDVGQFM